MTQLRYPVAQRHQVRSRPRVIPVVVPTGGPSAWTLNPTDTTTSIDSLANRVGKNVSDSTTATDALVKRVGKSLTDTTTSTDAIVKGTGKSFTDTTTSTDSLARVVGYIRTFTDTTTSTDAFSSPSQTPPAAVVQSTNFGAFVDRGGMYERDNGRHNFYKRYKRRDG